MCGCEICISVSIIQCELNACISRHISNLISDYYISHSRRSCQERKKGEYINEVYPNGYHKYERTSHEARYINCRYGNSTPDSLPNWNCVLFFCFNGIKMITPEERFKMHHQTR